MKKKVQIAVFYLLVMTCSLIMFLTALITKEHILTPFAFALLIGGNIIRLLAKRETTFVSEVAKPKLTINQSWEKFWEKFTYWLNN